MPRAANLRMQEQGGKGVENEEENSGIRQLLGVKVRVAHFISYISHQHRGPLPLLTVQKDQH